MKKKILINCVQGLEKLTVVGGLTVKETKELYRTISLVKFWLKVLDDGEDVKDIACSLQERNDMYEGFDKTIDMVNKHIN